MNSKEMADKLEPLGACQKSLDWLVNLPERVASKPHIIWQSCDRGDWMMWLVARLGIAPRTVTVVAMNLSSALIKGHYIGKDQSPRICLAATSGVCWGHGNSRKLLKPRKATLQVAHEQWMDYEFISATAARSASETAHLAYIVQQLVQRSDKSSPELATAVKSFTDCVEYANVLIDLPNQREESITFSREIMAKQIRKHFRWSAVKRALEAC